MRFELMQEIFAQGPLFLKVLGPLFLKVRLWVRGSLYREYLLKVTNISESITLSGMDM